MCAFGYLAGVGFLICELYGAKNYSIIQCSMQWVSLVAKEIQY